METSISLTQLGGIIVFLLIVAVGGYAIFALRSLTDLLRNCSATLTRNESYLNKTICHLAELSENAAGASKDLRKSIEEMNQAITSISRDTADTVTTISKTADYVSSYAIVIAEIIKALSSLFATEKTK
jgi:ABC-type transporter Mla subunit MlaD